jgi:hypothetical protein
MRRMLGMSRKFIRPWLLFVLVRIPALALRSAQANP